MNASKTLLRRAQLTRQVLSVSGSSSAHTFRSAFVKPNHVRNFLAQPVEKVVCYDDLVKETLKKMISERDENESGAIDDEDLQSRFVHYENLFKEAELCIADLKEAKAHELEEEGQCAKGAVNNAFQAYLDLLDDLRLANDEQLKTYHAARLENANNLKRLRLELAELLGETL